MFKFFTQLKKHFFDSSFLPFIFLGLLLISQLLLALFLFQTETVVLILSLLALGVWLVATVIALNLIEISSRLDLERNQINAMIYSIDDPAVSYTNDFEIILVNPALEKFTNLKREELIGKVIRPELSNDARYGFLTKLIFPSLAPLVVERSADTYPQKIKVKFDQPRELTLEIVTTKVVDEHGNNYGFLKIIHDLTKDEALQKTQRDFITVAAHQLRTPLAGLSWILELLVKKELGPLTPEQEKLIKQGQEAVVESLKTVEDLLTASQIEEGKFGFQFTQADLIPIIEDVLTNFEPAASKKKVKLIFYRPNFKLEPFVMDPLRVKLVLEILVDNAIKYNVENGEVAIKLELDPKLPFINISVADTGQGIAPQDLSKLFTKFFRSEAVMKEETSGIGLGLYLAKNIVEHHGGKIWVESVVGRGSTFTFSLPLDPAYLPPQ